jgi:membrane protein CcdC involved in cytochrome C biogenesis
MKNNKDYTNGDHSFKKWFNIMWTNGYIFLFLVGLGCIITEFIMLDDVKYLISDNFKYSNFGGIITIIGLLIPWAITGLVTYKGFIQFWNDLKNGRSR